MEDNVLKKPSEMISSVLEVGDDNAVDELRVLAVDAQIFSLQYLCALLHKCNYKEKKEHWAAAVNVHSWRLEENFNLQKFEHLKTLTAHRNINVNVQTTTSAAEALEVLKANKHGFDIVLVDVDSANLNGFELLEIIGLEMYLPVIMVTGDGSLENINKGLVCGAVDYIVKPIGEQEIKSSIRHHVTLNKIRDSEQSSDYQEKSQDQIKLKPLEHSNASITVEEDKANIQSDDASSRSRKKKRLVWTPELDAKFVNAVKILEKSSMVHPKRILDIMNEPGLTRENIASHLQKYRISLNKRKAEAESELNRQSLELERVTQSSSITRSTKCRKWEVNEVNADRLAVPRGGITVMSQRMIPYVGSLVPTNQYGTFLYGCSNGRNVQTPDFKLFNYHNYCFEMNIQSHNLGSEPPYFPDVGSEPSTLTGVPFPSTNAFLAPETDVAFQSPFAVSSVPNLVSGGIPNHTGITMDYANNLQYPGSTIITGNGETDLVPNGTITSPTDISSQHNLERENEVSEMDNNQVKDSLDEGCFNFFSLFNDEDHSGLTFSL